MAATDTPHAPGRPRGSGALFRLLVFRALANRLRRVSVVFSALAVGAAIVCAMAAVYYDIDAKMSRELRTFGANFYVGPADAGGMPQSDYEQILAGAPPGLVIAGTPYLYGAARAEMARIALVGANFGALRQLSPYWQVTGGWIGVDFDDRNAMAGRKLAAKLEISPGDTLTLLRDETGGGLAKKVLGLRGVIEAGDAFDSVLLVNLAVAQEQLAQPGRISHALLRVNTDDPAQAEGWAARIERDHPGLEARPIRKVSASEGQVLEKIKGLMGLVCLVILVLSTLCVNTTLTAMVGERSREFALQKALGAPHRAIVLQLLVEAALVAIAAIAAGLALGWLLAQILGQAVFSSPITLRAPVFPLTALLSLLVALVAAIVPVRRAMTLQPAQILKGE